MFSQMARWVPVVWRPPIAGGGVGVFATVWLFLSHPTSLIEFDRFPHPARSPKMANAFEEHIHEFKMRVQHGFFARSIQRISYCIATVGSMRPLAMFAHSRWFQLEGK